MSGGGEHLKDEVGSPSHMLARSLADNGSQGSKQQVVIAGAIAGLVSRYVQSRRVSAFIPMAKS